MSTATPDARAGLPDAVGAGYAPTDEQRPLGAYVVLSGVFFAVFGGALLVAHRSGRPLPERLSMQDVLLTGVATHKLSRVITKYKVTSFLRAPFTRFRGRAGHGELEEEPRGRGLRLATGELLVCPYCLAEWVAGGFVVGFVYAPRVTRLLAGMWTAYAVADAMQLAYSAAAKRT
jgi:hypothetical protein